MREREAEGPTREDLGARPEWNKAMLLHVPRPVPPRNLVFPLMYYF